MFVYAWFHGSLYRCFINGCEVAERGVDNSYIALRLEGLILFYVSTMLCKRILLGSPLIEDISGFCVEVWGLRA